MNLTTATEAELVEEGVKTAAEIKRLEKHLAAIQAELLSRKKPDDAIPLADSNRDGSRILLQSERHSVPIQQTADSLKTKLEDDAEIEHAQVLSGNHFLTLFKEVKGYTRRQKDGKQFRSMARELIQPPECEKLIKLMTVPGKNGAGSNKTFINWSLAKEA